MLFNQDEIDKLNQERLEKMEKELGRLNKELEGFEIKEPIMTEGYPYICRCESFRKKKDKEGIQ